MFWEKNYTPSQNIEVLLEKENVKVEEFLDEDDIIQECKSQKKALIAYFTRPDILRRLVELIITIPSEDLPVAQRFRHANAACEILTLGLPSLDEKLLGDTETLQLLYSYLKNPPPLNPLLSSFFSKTFTMLFTKKTDQDWFLYQQMCLKLLEYIKLQNNFVDLICKHFVTPVIPDLILQMLCNVEGSQLRRNLYDWLNEERLIEKIIDVLANVNECENHANVSEFLCDLIQQGRIMRQTEQDNDLSFEPVFEGSNPILKNIESASTLNALFNVILQPNAQESTIVSGITVVLKIIKPILILDERNPDRLKFIQDREKEIHDELINTVISVIEPHLKYFNELLKNPPNKLDIVTTAAKLSPPFGMTRLQICRLFTVLLQTNNDDISKAICETDFFETLLDLFKQYCWNNFLHSEVEKCLQSVFHVSTSNNNNCNMSTQINNSSSSQNKQTNTMLNENHFSKNSNDDNTYNIKLENEPLTTAITTTINNQSINSNQVQQQQQQQEQQDEEGKEKENTLNNESVLDTVINIPDCLPNNNNDKNKEYISNEDEDIKMELVTLSKNNEEDYTTEIQNENATHGDFLKIDNNLDNIVRSPKKFESKEVMIDTVSDNKGQDTTKASMYTEPSKLQTHVIVKCKIVCKLISCWQHNREIEEGDKGRRLGYMGHLIQIFKHINNCITQTNHIGALIEDNFRTESEHELWQSIVNGETGDLSKALKIQSQLLANYNGHEACDYNISLDFLTDTDLPDAFNNLCVDEIGGGSSTSNNMDDDDDDNNIIEDNGDLTQINCNVGDAGSLSIYNRTSSLLSPFNISNNPWEMNDDFNSATPAKQSETTEIAWTSDFGTDNFADFDAHFSSFSSDLGETFSTTHMPPNNSVGNNNSSVNLSNLNNSNSDKINDAHNGTNDANYNFMISTSSPSPSPSSTSSLSKNVETYGNNLNVDKSSLTWAKEFKSFPLNKGPTFIGCNIVDDYENDDGMWIRPLGVCDVAASTTANNKTLSLSPCNIDKETDIHNNLQICSTNANLRSTTNGPIYTQIYSLPTSHTVNTTNTDVDTNYDVVNKGTSVLVSSEPDSITDSELLLSNSIKDNDVTLTNININENDYNSDHRDNLNEINFEKESSMHNSNAPDNEYKLANINYPNEIKIVETVGNVINNVATPTTTT